jgi:Rrf2 family protein
MLGKTSISALRTLLLLAQQGNSACWSPRRLAALLDESPTYLAKVVRHLVRAGILEAEKGVRGGVRLLKSPEQITLLAVVEACQGTIVGNYCEAVRPASLQCNFHRAAVELHRAITGILTSWTLSDLLREPTANCDKSTGVPCFMAGGLNTAPGNKTACQLMQAGGRV